MRASLQSVLTACAGSLGLTAQVAAPGEMNFPDAAQEISDSEEDRRSKRARSKDPGGTSAPSS